MKAVQFSRFGFAADVVELVEVPDPGPPGAGEVLVDILAAPINPSSLLNFEGRYGVTPPALPARMGGEAVGRVAELGAGVSHLRVGDRVLTLFAARTNWCERIKAPAAALRALPEQADTLQLAMMAVNPATAWLMLETIVPLVAGEWIIQNAANSGVGHCVIQLAQQMGVRTISLVRRPDPVDRLRADGSDVVLIDGPDLAERVSGATQGAQIRLALDAVAGEATGRLAQCLVPSGTVVTYGRLSSSTCVVNAAEFVFRDIAHRGFWLGKWLETAPADQRTAMYDEIERLIVRGAIRIEVEATYPLARVKEALAHAARPGRSGKVLLLPNPQLIR
jgi:trans-2-enoyl-CoA reductase